MNPWTTTTVIKHTHTKINKEGTHEQQQQQSNKTQHTKHKKSIFFKWFLLMIYSNYNVHRYIVSRWKSSHLAHLGLLAPHSAQISLPGITYRSFTECDLRRGGFLNTQHTHQEGGVQKRVVLFKLRCLRTINNKQNPLSTNSYGIQ